MYIRYSEVCGISFISPNKLRLHKEYSNIHAETLKRRWLLAGDGKKNEAINSLPLVLHKNKAAQDGCKPVRK